VTGRALQRICSSTFSAGSNGCAKAPMRTEAEALTERSVVTFKRAPKASGKKATSLSLDFTADDDQD
jgi:hypothetical protein